MYKTNTPNSYLVLNHSQRILDETISSSLPCMSVKHAAFCPSVPALHWDGPRSDHGEHRGSCRSRKWASALPQHLPRLARCAHRPHQCCLLLYWPSAPSPQSPTLAPVAGCLPAISAGACTGPSPNTSAFAALQSEGRGRDWINLRTTVR